MRYLCCVLVIMGLTSTAAAQTVVIDAGVEHQTIDGFGGFGAKKVPWDSPPLWDQPFVDAVINDLGLTILRVEVPANFEVTNDNGRRNDRGHWDGDPGTLDLDKFNVARPVEGTHQPLASQVEYVRAMKAAADKAGQPLAVVASIWTPPAWMKYTNSVAGQDHAWNRLSDGTHAHPDYYPEFAEFCEAYVRIFKRETGVDLHALSLQNEPHFAQSYQSCVYSPAQLRDVIKVVGGRFERGGVATRIFGPEDVSVFARIKDYIVTACEDPAARQHLDILAVHGYGEGGTRADESGPRVWADTFDLARRYNKPLWQTETSGYPDTFDGALRLAEHIHTALAFGNVSAWVWWSLSEDRPSEYSLMVDGRPTSRYFVSKQFYRYVRPGAVRIGCETGDPDVVATAYKHPAERTLTIVLLNRDTAGRSIVLRGDALPGEFTGHVTTADQNCAPAGKFRREVQVVLPPRSVMTLVATGYDPPAPPAGPRIVRQPAAASAAEGERAEFSVAPAGPFPWAAQFQWLRDGTPVAGATLPTYAFGAVTSADDGAAFAVDVTVGGKTVRSAPATLTVLPFAGVMIVRATAPPIIDGNPDDAAWAGAKAYPLANLVGGEVAPGGDLAATVRAAWDERALYLLYDVTDDRRQAAVPVDGGSFNNDGAEVYLDGDNAKSPGYGSDDFQFALTAGTDRVEEIKHKATRGVTFATADRAGGYVLEARIPWATLGVTPRAGLFVGFDAHVNDSDTTPTRTAKLAWFATKDDVWESPARMGTAKLAE